LLHAGTMQSPPDTATSNYATAWGVACGAGAALFWALGFVAARQGVTSGLSPLVIALHRFMWPGFALLPLVAKNNFADLRMIGLGRGAALALFGGLPLALFSYVGYILVPLGHGAVIQPSCAALGGLVLSRLVLKEPLPPRRIVGAATIVIGLAVIGADDRRPWRARRFALCRGGKLFRHFRRAGAALADWGYSGDGGDKRALARRVADPLVQLRQYAGGRSL
jgi:hypothetical protein